MIEAWGKKEGHVCKARGGCYFCWCFFTPALHSVHDVVKDKMGKGYVHCVDFAEWGGLRFCFFLCWSVLREGSRVVGWTKAANIERDETFKPHSLSHNSCPHWLNTPAQLEGGGGFVCTDLFFFSVWQQLSASFVFLQKKLNCHHMALKCVSSAKYWTLLK